MDQRPSNFYDHAVFAPDVNGDGKVDLVGDWGVALGNGDGTFKAPIPLPAGMQSIWHKRSTRINRRQCCRFCSGQSTNDQQGSTDDGVRHVSSSIDCTYFQRISIGFNKSFDLFWEQRVGGSNPSAPTSINY